MASLAAATDRNDIPERLATISLACRVYTYLIDDERYPLHAAAGKEHLEPRKIAKRRTTKQGNSTR